MVRVAQDTMQAVALDRFGGPDVLSVRHVPVPEVGLDEVMVRIETAGVGVWDPFEIAGGFAEMFGTKPTFPYVPGSDGAGTVVATGRRVTRFHEGDRVYVFSLVNPKGGCYAEYVVVSEDDASHIPGDLTIEEAGAMPVCAMTALRGLEALDLEEGDSLIIVGASGGIGHLAVQLATLMGARVLAVASGPDGVALCERLGADAVVDGRGGDVPAAARAFAPDGCDAALLTAGGEVAEQALAALRDDGRAAFPSGVEPEPEGRPDLTIQRYDGMPDLDAIERLNGLIRNAPFHVHIARRFPLNEVTDAIRALDEHYLGKIVLKPGNSAS